MCVLLGLNNQQNPLPLNSRLPLNFGVGRSSAAIGSMAPSSRPSSHALRQRGQRPRLVVTAAQPSARAWGGAAAAARGGEGRRLVGGEGRRRGAAARRRRGAARVDGSSEARGGGEERRLWLVALSNKAPVHAKKHARRERRPSARVR
jgi:hypothetical protein